MKVIWLPHKTFTNHQGAKKKAFPKQNIVFWQISLLKTVFTTLDTLWSRFNTNPNQGFVSDEPYTMYLKYSGDMFGN